MEENIYLFTCSHTNRAPGKTFNATLAVSIKKKNAAHRNDFTKTIYSLFLRGIVFKSFTDSTLLSCGFGRQERWIPHQFANYETCSIQVLGNSIYLSRSDKGVFALEINFLSSVCLSGKNVTKSSKWLENLRSPTVPTKCSLIAPW